MANYIKNEVLCEAYSRLNVDIGDDPVALEKLQLEMVSFFTQRAQFLFGDDVTVVIEFEKGSLITKLKVLGSAALVLNIAFTAYGSFRQSVDYLVKDSSLLAQSANLEMVFRTKAAYCDRIRVEKRKGVFGRVDELLGELDAIKKQVGESSMPRTKKAATGFDKATTERLLEWHKKVGALFDKLDHNDTKACVSAGFLEELEQFPSVVPWEKDLRSNSFRTNVATSDPEQAGLLEGSSTRYKRTVSSLKKSYEDYVRQYAPKST